ncbi:hypothetical protein Tco_0721625 [Tanacetum coccineum]
MVKLSTTFILKLSRLCGLVGGSGPLSSPRLSSKDGQIGSTSIRKPIVSSTSSGHMYAVSSLMDTAYKMSALVSGSRPLSSPRLSSKDGQLGSTSIGKPIVSLLLLGKSRAAITQAILSCHPTYGSLLRSSSQKFAEFGHLSLGPPHRKFSSKVDKISKEVHHYLVQKGNLFSRF